MLIKRRSAALRCNQAGLAPGVPHLANRPLPSLHLVAFAGALVGHFANFPLASLQGAAAVDGVAVASTANEAAAIRSFLYILLLHGWGHKADPVVRRRQVKSGGASWRTNPEEGVLIRLFF
jgi:hypothetical protein